MSLCELIKARLPLREAARLVNVTLPERDGVKFASPLRPDRKPSCTIQGDTMRDWSRGETFDAIAFFATAKGMSNAEAVKALAQHLKITSGSTAPKVKVAGAAPKQRQQEPRRPAAPSQLPEAIPYTRELAEAVAASRGLSADAVQVACTGLGTISFGEVCGHRSWIISDRGGKGWEARRIDGEPYPPLEPYLGERKTHAKGKGVKSWPMGILPPLMPDDEIAAAPIVLCEGMPDYLAAVQIILDHVADDQTGIVPACMLGKSADISADALPLFKNRPVLIIGHPDARDRITLWAKQIRNAGAASVRPVRLLFRDLNDHVLHYPHRIADLVSALGLTPKEAAQPAATEGAGNDY